MNNLKEKLANLDLSSREADVYLAILSLGKSSISDISRKSKIKRTTVYEYIESLLKKNLIYKTAEKKRTFYCVENPNKIIKLLDDKKAEIDFKKQQIGKVIPELQSLYSSSFNKPNISFYEGEQGIKQVYEEMLNTHKNVYSIFSPVSFFKLFSFEENHRLLMILFNNGGILHNLVEKSDKAIERLKRKEYSIFVKNKLLPDGFKFETDLLIVDDTIALISFRNLVGVIIKDRAIADLQKNIFNLIWKMNK
jgi:HTH-type transcriptional regulator, sugar sensing transcriptional regulator